MRLRVIPAESYARDVLPLTTSLWAGRRTFEQYVTQTLEFARSGYGRRHYRTVGLYDGGRLVASFKQYERRIRDGYAGLAAVGFGAVFTPEEYRSRGYASVMLATALDQARGQGLDVAYLFSDIRPEFYAALGFRALPSHEVTLRADALPPKRVGLAAFAFDDRKAVAHAFERCETRRSIAFARSPALWEWIATRVLNGSEHSVGQAANFIVRRGRAVRAYVFGARAPERDSYVVDEYGFADDSAALLIPSLLRGAAGDLRRITGWLPPDGARASLPKGTTRKRKRAVLMMAALSARAERVVRELSRESAADFCWATDHI
jgi:GNAT superfamily N-acetyltransferase